MLMYMTGLSSFRANPSVPWNTGVSWFRKVIQYARSGEGVWSAMKAVAVKRSRSLIMALLVSRMVYSLVPCRVRMWCINRSKRALASG